MDGNNNMNTPPNNGANKSWNYDPVTGEPIFSNDVNLQPPYPQAYQPTPEQIKQQQKIHDNSNNTALTLCIFSLCSWALGNVVLFGERILTDIFGYYYTRYILPTSGFFLIAGFVLAVIALIKYPKNTFAKVLVAVYIIEVILLIILVIIAIVACVLVLRSCAMSCGDCLRIG